MVYLQRQSLVTTRGALKGCSREVEGVCCELAWRRLYQHHPTRAEYTRIVPATLAGELVLCELYFVRVYKLMYCLFLSCSSVPWFFLNSSIILSLFWLFIMASLGGSLGVRAVWDSEMSPFLQPLKRMTYLLVICAILHYHFLVDFLARRLLVMPRGCSHKRFLSRQ